MCIYIYAYMYRYISTDTHVIHKHTLDISRHIFKLQKTKDKESRRQLEKQVHAQAQDKN